MLAEREFTIAANELTWKVTVDPALAARAMRELAQEAKRSTATITAEVRKEAQSAVSLQRQRSGALVAQWKSDNSAAISLQRQRSAALVAAWKAEQREQVRIAREAQRQVEQAAAESQRRRSAFGAGLVGGVTALVGVSAISEIRNAASAWLDYSSKLETTKIAFTTMLGSAQLAEQHLKELQNFALKTPFQFGELIDASQRMQALGFSAQQIVPILTDVGNAVAAAGGGSERLDRVVLALSQIQSKGKLMTQEMNQLAESGIPAWKMLEEQLGKSRGELVKMVEQGQISSAVFLEAFQKFSQQNFGGLMEAQSKTFSGAMSNIKDALLQTSATAFAPLYERLSENARALAELSTKSKEFQENLTTAGSQVIRVWDGVVTIFYVVRDVIGLVAAAAISIIGLWTHAIMALYHAVRALYLNLKAVAQIAAGDFFGGMNSARMATEAARLATSEATDALKSQGAVAQQVARIYEEAEGRKAAAAISAAQKIAAAQLGSTYSGPDRVGGSIGLSGGLQPGTRGVGIPSGGGGGSRAAKVSEGQRLLNQLTEEHNRLTAKANELSKVQIVALEILDKKYKDLSSSVRHQILEKAAEIDVAQKSIDADKRKEQATEKIRQFLERQTQAIREARISTDEYADAVAKLESDVLREYGLRMDANTRKMLLENAAVEKALTLTRERIVLEQTRIDLMERERLATPERKQEQLERESGIFRSEGDETRSRRAGDSTEDSRTEMQKLFDLANENLTGESQVAALAGLEALSTAFEGLASAVGSAVEAWVLYGNAGTSIRKVTAQILAAVAAQAAVKAIFELAEGFAALARMWFGDPKAGAEAAAHFKAAAIYGAVAAVAAVSGRAVAGDAFKQASGTGGGGGGSGSGGSSTAKPKPGTTDVNRNALAQPTGTLTINLGLKQGIVAEEFRKDYMLNGPTRLIIKTDGQG